MEGGQYPATATIDYLKLAASQVGEMRAKLDEIYANIRQAEDDVQTVFLPLDYPTFIKVAPYNAAGPGGEYFFPAGDWKSIIILWPSARQMQWSWDIANGNVGYDLVYTGSSGFTAILQPNPTALPIFGDKWGRLYAFTNPSGTPPVLPNVPAILSKREYYTKPTFGGY